MWIVLIIVVAGFLLWRNNNRRGHRFVRSVYFLNELDRNATIDEANGQVARLFTKHSTPETDGEAIRFAMGQAQRWTQGKQLPWIHRAREQGLAIDSGNTRLDLAHLHDEEI